MIIKTIPRLSPGDILRQTAITAISDAAFLTNEYLLKGYADGILSGCGLEATEDTIIVQEGTVFLNEEIFLIKKPLTINYGPANTTMALKMCFSAEIRDGNCIYRDMNLVITGDTSPKKGEIELCRFKLQEGAKLRNDYQDFKDRSTEFDTMNRVNSPYAAYGRSTLSPDITRAFAQEMLDLTDRITDFDAAFCIQILAGGSPISSDAVLRYIERAGRKKPIDTTNMGMFTELARILEDRKGKSASSQANKQKKWKMTME